MKTPHGLLALVSALLVAGTVSGAGAQTPTAQGPATATGPSAAPVLTALPGITCLVQPEMNAAARAVFSGSPTLGDVPDQSLRLRIVVQVFQAPDGMLQAESSVGPLPELSSGGAAQPDPDLIQRALAALAGGNVPTVTNPIWATPPAVAGVSPPNLQGIAVVELWDATTKVGMVVYGDSADRILQAAMGQVQTLERLGAPLGPVLQGSCA